MCGFVIAYAKDRAAGATQAMLDAMDGAIRHRGPDEHGQAAIGPLQIGHRRLSIIDLSGGKQPMSSEDGRWWLAYNGEIYNYRDVRRELEALGHRFRDRSDTEVLLNAWRQWGADCLPRLNGMFAFAIYDTKNDVLSVVRDRFGEKPLYYTETRTGLYFASELKGLIAAGVVEKRIDPRALYSYFTLGYVAGEDAIFHGVKRLAPGQLLTYSPAVGIATSRWWMPPLPTEELDDAEAVAAQSLELLRDSVGLRMVSDVPLGFFLSGGVDSSAMVALASEVASGSLETFSIGFDDPRLDERPHARFVADRFRTKHHEFVVAPQHLDMLEAIAWHADEPFADQAALPTWFLSEMTRQHVTVALSGDGGDELFAGYDVYRGHELSEKVGQIPGPIRKIAVSALRASARFRGDSQAALRRARNIEDSSLPGAERFSAKQQTVFRREFLRAAAPSLSSVATCVTDRTLFAPLFRGDVTPLGAIAYWQQTTSLPDDMLHKVDRMSMAHSLEVRAPFLDHRLFDLLNRTSFAAKLPGGRQKFILRKAMARYFPEDFLWRRKQGFNVPLARWFKGDLSSHIRERLLSRTAISRAVVDTAVVERILGEHLAGTRSWDNALWAFLMFEEWCRAYGVTADAIAHA